MREYKITVIGDIMGEPPVLEQAKREKGNYDFLPMLKGLKPYFDEADYGIANLETVLAGETAGYSQSLVSFNSPDELADAVKAIGINAVTTANNHCMDRGPEGIVRTCRVLDEKHIAHTGTHPAGTADKTLFFSLGKTRVALLSYTVGCNSALNTDKDFSKADEMINFLRPHTGLGSTRLPEDPALGRTKRYIEEKLGRKLSWEEMIMLRKAMGLPIAFKDDLLDTAPLAPFLEALRREYETAREKADIVLFMPHTGGQFNTEPGKLSQQFFHAAADIGFDAVLASHSHTTQRAERIGKTILFNSLGNVTMSPCTEYSVRESLPEYGIAAHLYIAEKKIVRTAFSIFKMVENENEPLHTIPCDTLYSALPEGKEKAKLLLDIAEVYERVARKPFASIEREYHLFSWK